MIGTALSLAVRVCGIGIYFGAMVVLARALAPHEFGLYSYAIEIVALLSALTSLGLNMIAIRFVPDFLSKGDGRGILSFVHFGIVTSVIGATLFGAVLLAAWYRGWLIDDYAAAGVIAISFLLITFSIVRFLQEIMRAARRILMAQVAEQLGWPLVLLGIGTGLWLSSGPGGFLVVIILQTFFFTACGLGLYLVSRAVATSILDDTPHPLPSRKAWIAVGWPLALSTMMLIFINRGDILALGAFAGPREVALYTPASRYAALMILGQAAASMAMAGHLRETWSQGNRNAFQAQVNDMASVSVLFAIMPFAVFMTFPEKLLSLFGSTYVAATDVLRVLALAQLINAWTGPIAVMAVICELQRIYALCVGLACAGLTILLVVLIPPYGNVGAAVATLVSISGLNLVMSAVVWRRTRMRCWATIPSMLGFVRSRSFEIIGMMGPRNGS